MSSLELMFGLKAFISASISRFRCFVGNDFQKWIDVYKGLTPDWDGIFTHPDGRSYLGTLDYPACGMYQELMEAFPEAKVLLTVRDPEKWYDSVIDTIWSWRCGEQNWSFRWVLRRDMLESASPQVRKSASPQVRKSASPQVLPSAEISLQSMGAEDLNLRTGSTGSCSPCVQMRENPIVHILT